MSLSTTLLLGFIAGITIVLGLPIGRLQRPAPGLRVFLNATAVGVLLFLFWDVSSAAWEPVDAALSAVHGHTGGLAPVFGYGGLFAAGLAVGLLGLVGYDRYMAGAAGRAVSTVKARVASGPTAPSAVTCETLNVYSPSGRASSAACLPGTDFLVCSGVDSPARVTAQSNLGWSPVHAKLGAATRVGPAGPSVMTGAADGGVGSIVNVRVAASRELPALS